LIGRENARFDWPRDPRVFIGRESARAGSGRGVMVRVRVGVEGSGWSSKASSPTMEKGARFLVLIGLENVSVHRPQDQVF